MQGLSAAFFAARLGHATAIYEAQEELGGLLRSAIARQRLPMAILDWDINGILDMGVTTHTGQQFGQDLTVSDLLSEGYQAVLLTVGGWDSRLTRTHGRGEASPAPGCHLLIDVAKAGSESYPSITLNGHVIIIGNTHLTPELIERCKTLGAAKITLVTREAGLMAMDPTLADVRVAVGISRLHGQDKNLLGVELTDLESGTREAMDANHVVFTAGRIPELIYTPTPNTA